MREVTNPMAIARVHWLNSRYHLGRDSTLAVTAVFVTPNSTESLPESATGSQHFSVILALCDPEATIDEDFDAKLDFIDRVHVAKHLREDATLVIMAGHDPIAHAHIISVSPDLLRGNN